MGFTTDRVAARKRELQFTFVLSTVLHAGMLAVLVTSPLSRVRMPPPPVISVDLVAAAGAPPDTPSKTAPKVAPVRVPKKTPKLIVLPKEATSDPSRPRAKAKRRPEIAPDPKPPEQVDYSDALAQLRADAGEVTPLAQPRKVASVKPPAASDRSGQPVSPVLAVWIRRTKAHIKGVWVLTPGFRTQELSTSLVVDIDSGGKVRGEPEIVMPSGNPWYDQGVVRAIVKASPLPPPPEAGRWPFVFVPEDSY